MKDVDKPLKVSHNRCRLSSNFFFGVAISQDQVVVS